VLGLIMDITVRHGSLPRGPLPPQSLKSQHLAVGQDTATTQAPLACAHVSWVQPDADLLAS
jgi:hypothetical protein